jgi:7,8-dihydropterin-6-yl-methyl-4-(beta-D-ribofuranosyl)aminobenzene 5'-phosphate synthase
MQQLSQRYALSGLCIATALFAGACTSDQPTTQAQAQAAQAPAPGVALSDIPDTAVAAPGEAAVVTVLTTNGADMLGSLTQPLQGEWSFAAWVEVGDQRILFDTGWSPRNVLSNAEALGIDLSTAEDLVLSHNHLDHTGGLETLRTEMAKRNPAALSRIHVAEGIFDSRPAADGAERNPMVAAKARLEALGSEFIVHSGPAEIGPGVWVTGPVPRVHDERNYPTGEGAVFVRDGVRAPDTIPESQSLVVLAQGGPVFVSGCGHAGLINTLVYGREAISQAPPQAAIGGFHLFNASEDTLRWTAENLRAEGLGHLLGSHCTGFETVVRIRELAAMQRERAVIGAVGTRFETANGIVPGNINR